MARPSFKSSLFVLLLPFAVGCSPADDSEKPENSATQASQEQLIQGMVPVEPFKRRFRRHTEPDANAAPRIPLKPGLPLPNDHPDLVAARAAEEAVQQAMDRADPARTRQVPAGRKRLIHVDENHDEWEVEFDASALDALHGEGLRRGLNDAPSVVNGEPTPPESSPQGIGIDHPWTTTTTDDRRRMAINFLYPAYQRELRTIGGMRDSSGCSGVLVGRRLVLTAAHCVVDYWGNSIPVKFTPRRSYSGTGIEYRPYGSENGVTFFWEPQWIANFCHKVRVQWCHQFDWAIVLLPANSWSNPPVGYAPGWMGYATPNISTLANFNVSHNDGYPADWAVGAPAGQAVGEQIIWGERRTNGSRATDFWHYSWGHPRLYHTASDLSGGHSGSPNWSDAPGSNGPYAIGITSYERCNVDCGDMSQNYTLNARLYPNGFRNMTPGLAAYISNLRTQYP